MFESLTWKITSVEISSTKKANLYSYHVEYYHADDQRAQTITNWNLIIKNCFKFERVKFCMIDFFMFFLGFLPAKVYWWIQ